MKILFKLIVRHDPLQFKGVVPFISNWVYLSIAVPEIAH